MRFFSLVFVLLMALCAGTLGQKPVWQRVHTSEDLIIELDASAVTFVASANKRIDLRSVTSGRVKFRTLYSKSQLLKGTESAYKTRLETIEFQCVAPSQVDDGVTLTRGPKGPLHYRLHDASLLDVGGKTIKVFEWNPAEEWKELRFGSVMAKLAEPACKLIEEKRRNP